jgi:hypothetical protein
VTAALLMILAASQPLACPKLARHTLREAAEHHVRPALLDAVAKVETGCDGRKVGSHGERSAWQLLPGGSAARGRKRGLASPRVGAHLAAAHLERLLAMCDGSEVAALGIYQGARRRCSEVPTPYASKVLAIAGEP